MPQFDNPYQDDPTKARVIPGAVAREIATMIKGLLSMVGVKMYDYEEEGLAHALGAVLRSYPYIGEKWRGNKT